MAITRLLMVSGILLGASCTAVAGEVVDGVYIARQNGSIRIPLGDGQWQAGDREASGPTAIATLRLKAPIVGVHPSCDVTSAQGMVANVGHEEFAELVARGMLDAGLDLGPRERRHFGNRAVVRFNVVLNRRGGGSAVGEAYVLRGDKDYYVVNCTAPAAAYEAARPAFDALVGSLSY